MLHSHFHRRYYDGESILSARYTIPTQKRAAYVGGSRPHSVAHAIQSTASQVTASSVVSAHAVRKQYQVVTVPARPRVQGWCSAHPHRLGTSTDHRCTSLRVDQDSVWSRGTHRR